MSQNDIHFSLYTNSSRSSLHNTYDNNILYAISAVLICTNDCISNSSCWKKFGVFDEKNSDTWPLGFDLDSNISVFVFFVGGVCDKSSMDWGHTTERSRTS